MIKAKLMQKLKPYRLSTDAIPERHASQQAEDLLRRIERYLVKHNMADSSFGMFSCHNSHVVSRLREGGDIKTGTAVKIELFLKQDRQ